MSLAGVRSIVAGFFGGAPAVVDGWTSYRSPKVAGVATLFTATPSTDDENDYFQGLAKGSSLGVKAAVHIARKTSQRTSFGGDSDGIRSNGYQITLRIFGLTSAVHAELAQDDFDAVLDGIEAFLYADRSLGTLNRTDGYLIDGGEGAQGVQITQPPPSVGADNRTWFYAEVAFNVREWIHG